MLYGPRFGSAQSQKYILFLLYATFKDFFTSPNLRYYTAITNVQINANG